MMTFFTFALLAILHLMEPFVDKGHEFLQRATVFFYMTTMSMNWLITIFYWGALHDYNGTWTD